MRSQRRFENGLMRDTDHWGHDSGPLPVVAMFAVVLLVLGLVVLATYHPQVFYQLIQLVAGL